MLFVLPFALISHFLVDYFFHALERSYSSSVAYVHQKDIFNNAFAGLSLWLIIADVKATLYKGPGGAKATRVQKQKHTEIAVASGRDDRAGNMG